MFIFVFQAEDGIRNLTVTGVQTCALPISQLASRETFARYGLDWPAYLAGVQVRTVRAPDGRQMLKLRSTEAISEPFITLLVRSEEHTSELQSQSNLVCRLLLEKKISPERIRHLSYIHWEKATHDVCLIHLHNTQ